MHEHHAVKNLVEQILTKSQENKAVKITKVNIALGELVGFDDESIKLYFSDFSKGTILEGAQIVINHYKPKLLCKDCSKVFEDVKREFKCPFCCSESVILNKGKEFYVENIEIETA